VPYLAASSDWLVLAKEKRQAESSDRAHHHQESAARSSVMEPLPLSLLMSLFLALFERRVDHRFRFHVGLHFEFGAGTAQLGEIACETTGFVTAHLLFPFVLFAFVLFLAVFLFLFFFAEVLHLASRNAKNPPFRWKGLGIPSKQRAVASICLVGTNRKSESCALLIYEYQYRRVKRNV
jgi:hypothetical protein